MNGDPLRPWREELQSLGFSCHSYTPDDLVGVRLRGYWSLGMRLTFVVRVKRFARLDLAQAKPLEAHLAGLGARLEPSLLPRGLQQGRFLIDVLVADEADEQVRNWAAHTISRGFATSYHPVLLCGGQVYHDKLGFYGAALWPAIAYVIGRMAAPGSPRPPETVGALGLLLGILVFWPGIFVIALCCCGLPVLLAPLVAYLERDRKRNIRW